MPSNEKKVADEIVAGLNKINTDHPGFSDNHPVMALLIDRSGRFAQEMVTDNAGGMPTVKADSVHSFHQFMQAAQDQMGTLLKNGQDKKISQGSIDLIKQITQELVDVEKKATDVTKLKDKPALPVATPAQAVAYAGDVLKDIQRDQAAYLPRHGFVAQALQDAETARAKMLSGGGVNRAQANEFHKQVRSALDRLDDLVVNKAQGVAGQGNSQYIKYRLIQMEQKINAVQPVRDLTPREDTKPKAAALIDPSQFPNLAVADATPVGRQTVGATASMDNTRSL